MDCFRRTCNIDSLVITQPLRSLGLSENLGVVKGELKNKRQYNNSNNKEYLVKQVKVAQRTKGLDILIII